MPVTRSEGKGRKPPTDMGPSSSEGTETATTSGTSRTDSSETTTTRTTVTMSTETAATETSAATTSTAGATDTTKNTARGETAEATVTTPAGSRQKALTEICLPTEGSTVDAREQRKHAASTRSRAKAYKIAKAKEEMARLQLELATARLAVLEAEHSESDDEVSICSRAETHTRVDVWLNTEQPAISNEPHHSFEEPKTAAPEPDQVKPDSLPVTQRSPAGAPEQTDIAKLTSAITLAIKAGQRPKLIELPVFNGAHQEWLSFRAAYVETEGMFSNIENINRLRRNLKGRAKEAVESQLITNAHPSDVMKTLESRFGRPKSIAIKEMDTLRALPRLTESPIDICIVATKVTNVVSTLRALDCHNYLYNPEISKALVDKLTSTLRYRYYDFAASKPADEPDLVTFERFMRREADLCAPYAPPENITSNEQPLQRRLQRTHTVTEKQSTGTARCPVCETTGHTTTDCNTFKQADSNARWDIAKDRRLCFRCLRVRNKTHYCKAKPCSINGCKYLHNKMLHFNKTEQAEQTKQNESTEAINSAWTAAARHRQSYLKIIPVRATGPKGTINTFALLDDGSTVTLVDASIAESIGAKGPVDPLHIEAIKSLKTAETESRRVSLVLTGSNNRKQTIRARTINDLRISPQKVSREEINGCEHLRSLTDVLSYENANPKILIGQDNWHLLTAKKMKKGNRNHPVASLTPLGWVLHGSHTRSLGRSIDFISHITEMPADENLEDLMKQYFTIDALCINPKKPKTDPEEQALRILKQNTVHTEEGRYETALLWRKSDISLPNNYENSLKRLLNIEKKLDRDPRLKAKYTEQMEALVNKGYAEPAPSTKTENKTWYLPHFAVVNPMKPEKLRVVHDAAAKTRGVALNDLLLKGPDLLQSLPGVVMRFRQHIVAVTADISEMFMQVKLRTQDRDALRYLWRGDRRDGQPPEEYRMTSLIFGASSSPSTAIYVKDVNAKRHEQTHPEAVTAIVKKHYVDDYLDSFTGIEDAIRVCTAVRSIQKEACFELKQWKSNSPELLEALGENTITEDIEVYRTEEKLERVLGLIWKPLTDQLTFNLDLARIPSALIEGGTPTKREALRIVMSLFDPLGLASPVTIKAKQLLQEVWRRGTPWDETIDEDLALQWESWMSHLKRLKRVAIPRRYLRYSDATSLQLHIFTDASETAYSAVVYWRATAPDGQVSVSLVIAKAKVAPLKLTSIPRLELQAAVMGARLAETVIDEHDKKPDTRTFWTDSRTVLTWVKTGSRSYKPYVAHRIAAIEEISTVNEWRWVPTKLNVADDATRDVPTDFNEQHRWYKGPQFLYEDEASWPSETEKLSSPIEAIEEERVNHTTVDITEKLSEALPDVSRFSNWERLRYSTARVLQFIELCKNHKERVNYKRNKRNAQRDPDWRKTGKITKPGRTTIDTTTRNQRCYVPVSAEHLITAEELLIRASQIDSFAREIEDMKNTKAVSKESRLHRLSITLINGALRLKGRIHATEHITDDLKNPLVVDGGHPTVKLWIEAVHRRMHHAGVEATVNECRQRYWVLRLRPTTRSILRRCLYCRMKTRGPPYPITGDLPPCRLAHHQRPFTYTGVDYFGPLTVTVGRTNQKRYVAIFTCLTTRAIHLEVAASLSTDSAVMALRRMIARRGRPSEIWSDNGTNLKGADRELRSAIDGATAQEAAKQTIKWRFIPPGAPFMGGAWERMVRSVKTALGATLHERRPYEEVLSTLLAEVEYTVNSRPLTHVSVSEEDPEALTPNHFLLGGPGNVTAPGEFTDKDTASKASWRAAQRLADIYWTRWLREYLPGLQHRREPHGKGPLVKVGDLVQLLDQNLPRNVWVRGRVVATYPGPDGIVRTVDVATQGGTLRRPVRKLVILPMESLAASTE